MSSHPRYWLSIIVHKGSPILMGPILYGRVLDVDVSQHVRFA